MKLLFTINKPSALIVTFKKFTQGEPYPFRLVGI